MSHDDALRQKMGDALEILAHRGPNGAGLWKNDAAVLGHRRLAIIDLSANGHQPMIDPGSGCVITFNGEIYNYVELRRDLQRAGINVETASDTEVLLKLYVHFGVDALEKLNGMWAFAIWDPRVNKLLLSRDRFGVKPLYYAFSRSGLIFASEPKAILTAAPELAVPDLDALRGLILSSRSLAGSSTYFRDIRLLPPASYAWVAPGDADLSPRPFWDYPVPAAPADRSNDRDQEEFAALFDDAVRLRMRSDVPVGLTLSGGLDSSAVLVGATRQGSGGIHSFTSVYSGTERGEEHWARAAAGAMGSRLHSVEAPVGDWLPTLERITWHMDAPGYSPAVFPLWAIMAEARRSNIPVLLEGQGADELLAGYPQYIPFALFERHVRRNLKGIVTHLRGGAATFGAANLIRWTLRSNVEPVYAAVQRKYGRGRLFHPATGGASPAPAPKGIPDSSPLFARLQRDHSHDVLPALLHYGDAISMAHGVESRLPFLDYRLVEWVFRTRPQLIQDGRTKILVRDYLAKGGLENIARRQDKKGYPTPLLQWLRAERSQIEDRVMHARSSDFWDIFDRRQVAALWRRAAGGHPGDANHFYKLLGTSIWLDQLKDWRSKQSPARAA